MRVPLQKAFYHDSDSKPVRAIRRCHRPAAGDECQNEQVIIHFEHLPDWPRSVEFATTIAYFRTGTGSVINFHRGRFQWASNLVVNPGSYFICIWETPGPARGLSTMS